VISDPYRLVQEDYQEDPWRVLLACMLLNQTSHVQARSILDSLLFEWPNASAMASAPPEEVTEMVAPIGLKKRGSYAVEMSSVYLKKRPVSYADVADLPGCGRYASEAWRMLIDGDRAFMPADMRLRRRMIWLRMRECEAMKTGQGDVALFLPGYDDARPAVLIPQDQTSGGYLRDVITLHGRELSHWSRLHGYEPCKIAERWLGDQSLIRLSERAEEACMLVLLSEKHKFIGKFEDDAMEEALAAAPEGSTLVKDVEELRKALDDPKALLAAYNSIVPKDERKKKFEEDEDPAEATWAAAEAKTVKVKPQKPAREPGAKERLRSALLDAGSVGLTMEAMKEVTGLEAKRVSDCMCYLKNPKYAGDAGPISIVKVDDRYIASKAA
jgi:methyl-CpG-binding domain protein 4